MRIAICDDEPKWVEIIKEKIENLKHDETMRIDIDCFTSQEELMFQSRIFPYHLIYLDIEMEGKNGIEIARELKELNERTIITFVTAYKGYVHDAFSVAAFQYIEKPIDDDFFVREFERALNHYKKTNLIKIVKVREGRVALNISEIIYMESYYNTAFIKTTRGTYITNYVHMRRLRKILLEYDFVRVQVGLLVNLHFVSDLKYKVVKLHNGLEFPISLTHFQEASHKYHKYLNVCDL